MNKTEMIEKLAKQTGLTKAQAGDAVNAIFDCESGKGIIAVELDAGRSVTIPGFGTFATSHRAAREGRNPQTGASLKIAARTVPTFKAGKSLKDRVFK
ncbi:MAG: HU family DNA-binding protein [Chloroflexi bacterium]|nr:HU family DNA-binding protein [Chloroflexota bacterium]